MVSIPEHARRHWRVIDKLKSQPDFQLVLIGAFYLAERLDQAIKACCVPEATSTKWRTNARNAVKSVFGGTGQCATLRDKIDIAFAVGAIGPKSYADLHRIRTIRDYFANPEHAYTHFSDVSEQCAKLWIPANVVGFGQEAPPSRPRQQFYWAVVMIWNLILSELSQGKPPGEPAEIIP